MEYAVNLTAWALERRSLALIVLHYNIAYRILWLAHLALTFINYSFFKIRDNIANISQIQKDNSIPRKSENKNMILLFILSSIKL